MMISPERYTFDHQLPLPLRDVSARGVEADHAVSLARRRHSIAARDAAAPPMVRAYRVSCARPAGSTERRSHPRLPWFTRLLRPRNGHARGSGRTGRSACRRSAACGTLTSVDAGGFSTSIHQRAFVRRMVSPSSIVRVQCSALDRSCDAPDAVAQRFDDFTAPTTCVHHKLFSCAAVVPRDRPGPAVHCPPTRRRVTVWNCGLAAPSRQFWHAGDI